MSMLNGATAPGDRGSYPSNPGEFAARWNEWPEEQRAEWLAGRTKTSQIAASCWEQNHRGQIERLQNACDPTRCPRCGGDLIPTMETRGLAYLTYEVCTGAECASYCGFKFTWNA